MRKFLKFIHGSLFEKQYCFVEIAALFWVWVTYPNITWWMLVLVYIGIVFATLLVRDVTNAIIDRLFMW